MIRIAEPGLSSELVGMLDKLQATIDALPDYAARVDAAKRGWESKPRERFEHIRETLRGMCAGEDRCMYCEDSSADEIEHVRPKSIYPDRTFRWTNYLLACGPCNGPKNNRFAVLSKTQRRIVEVTRRRGAPPTAPDAGRMMLIDPRVEDPMRYLILDLVFPFHYRPRRERCSLAQARAAYTIELLRLNRDPLPRRREQAYRTYRLRLEEYVAEPDPEARKRHRAALLDLDHLTVWREMQRQHARIPELHRLFDQIPGAERW